MAAPRLALTSPDHAHQALQLARLRIRLRLARGDVGNWRDIAHPGQTPPLGDWHTWYLRGGRGSGKTWTGSHSLAEQAVTLAGEWAAVGPTYADARDTCVEGPSGLLAALGTSRAEVERGTSRYVEGWNRSHGDLRLRNGSVIWADGADDGALRIQGKNLRGAWADEVGLWRRWDVAWNESLRYAVRLAPATIIATGTPKRGHPLIRQLMGDPGVKHTYLRTQDNAANLDPLILAEWQRLYAGTALGRQELEGEVLEDVPGALWSRDVIDGNRWPPAAKLPDFRRVVVAVDPEASSLEGAAETGIVVVASALLPADHHESLPHEHYFVLADATIQGTPNVWGAQAVTAYRTWKADRIVAEDNNGGEMVEHTLRTVDPTASVKRVHASRGKVARAEPVAALYEQAKVHHVGTFLELEDQQCSYVSGQGASPDRYDALVWGLTDLAIIEGPGLLGFYRRQQLTRAAAAAAKEKPDA